MAPWLTKPFGSSKLAAAIRSNASSRACAVSLMSSSLLPRPTNPPPPPVPAVDSPLDRILPAESVPRQAAWEGCTRQYISTNLDRLRSGLSD